MILPFIIAGVTTGSVYGLAGVGLVLTYKTSAIFNFAHGALGTVAAYLFFSLYVRDGMPWPLAALICIFLVGALLGLGLERIGRSLSTASLAVRVVATVGLLLIIQALAYLIYGAAQTDSVPQFLPTAAFHIGSTPVGANDVIVVGVGLLATAGLYAYFRFARTGVAMRAVVDNPDLLDMAGTSPTLVRRYAWVIGACFACASGVLLAPLVTLDPTTLTLLVVQAFGAAAIGRFTSLPITYLGGVAIGVASSLATKYFTSGLLQNLPSALPFIVLFVVLLVSKRSRLAQGSVLRPAHRATWRAPWPVQVCGGAAVLLLLLFVPSFAGTHLTDWTLLLTTTMLLLSLGLLVRTSGQVSLAAGGFTAIGACAFSHLVVGSHFPWALGLVSAGLIAIPIGALLAIPAIRLSGLYLALATLGFSVLLGYMFYNQSYMFGTGLGLTEPQPSGFTSASGFYYLVLALMVLTVFGLILLNGSRLGRLLRALADSPRGLAASGTSINVTRVLVFCLSAFLAAVAGALGAVAQGVVSADSYPPLLSLTYFAVVIIAIGGEPWYALLGGAGLALIPSYFPGTKTGYYLQLAFGVFALLYAITPDEMRGVPPRLAAAIDRFARPVTAMGRRMRPKPTLVPVGTTAEGRADGDVAATLEVSDLHVRFGGLIAVDGVNLTMATGVITGLIGPNGAGKSTTFDAICGANRRVSGTVALSQHDLARLGPSARARRGLGRTFQRMELFDSLTVAENVELGREGGRAGPNPFNHLVGRMGQRQEIRSAAAEVLAMCDIAALAGVVVGTLSTGQRRLVELARCLAGNFSLVLLDEPSSGLDPAETARFGEILQEVVEQRGLGIVLVEHDMSLVTKVCDYIYVLDFGKPIFEGRPAEVLAAPIVRAAYLGGDGVEEALEAGAQ